jgi:hypothetical protein
MKMRQFKRAKLVTMTYALFGPWGPIGQWLTPATSRAVRGAPEGTVVVDGPLVEAFKQGMAEQAAKYVVQRVKDNEIVGEFDSREEAMALVLKHVKQKKAKLHVFQNGEPVLFTEEETA